MFRGDSGLIDIMKWHAWHFTSTRLSLSGACVRVISDGCHRRQAATGATSQQSAGSHRRRHLLLCVWCSVGTVEAFASLMDQGRDNQRDCYLRDLRTPEPGWLYVHMDFGMSRTLPLGPRETGAYWYANARLQVNILTLISWSLEQPVRLYTTYLSDILDHTPAYVIAAFEDFCRKHPLAQGITGMTVWSDVGLHFRSYRSWGYFLRYVPATKRMQTKLSYFPPGHGKGPCDAHFALLRSWADSAARRDVLATVPEFASALQKRADMAMASHPEEAGYKIRYEIFQLTPPPTSKLPADVQSLDLCQLLDHLCINAFGNGDEQVQQHWLLTP